MGAMARRLEAPQEIEGFGRLPEIEQWAADELSHAIAHDWLEIAPLAPFTDVTECDPVRGCPYVVSRSYSWAGIEGGDIVCEVTVYATPDRRGHFVRRRCVINA